MKFEYNKMQHFYKNPSFGENWFTYPKLYSDMVKEFPSGSKFVEVGAWKGKSAAYMTVEIINSEKNIDFYVVDTWEGSEEHMQKPELKDLYEIFMSNMKPVENKFTPMRMSSLEASKLFDDDSLDFVFIDAAHDYDNVVADLKAWYPKIKKGGVLAGHDFYPDQPTWGDVYKAVRDVFGTNYLEVEGSCFAIRK
jgi:predicted O-methyltransferase YrrM